MPDEVKGQITAEMNDMLRNMASTDVHVAMAATRQFAQALTLPLRQGIMSGDITNGIFESFQLPLGASPEYPLDLLAPGTEKDFVAYTLPRHGRVPERTISSDYIMLSTYSIGNSIDWLLKYSRDARWDVVGRAMSILEAGFVKKINDDAYHVLLAGGVDRNIVVYDADANQGQFTKRLVSLMKSVMRRNGGGNSTSMNRGILTDIYMSPEGLEDIRNWGIDQVDEITRREIYTASDGRVNRIFSVNLHDIDELGEGQEYQDFFTTTLGGAMASGDIEILIGLDLRNRDSFVMPVREPVTIFEDETMHRAQRAGYYGWGEMGFGLLDNRRVILGSM